KKLFLLAGSAIMLSLSANAQCTEIFFSEYIEGSGNSKAVEIYNPTSSAIDLSGYSIFNIVNGGTATNSFALYGSLPAYGVFIIAADGANAAIASVADTLLTYPSIIHFNGDDAVILLKGTDTIDRIGESYVDPGSSWTVGSGSTKDNTLVRKSTIKGGQTDWTKGAGEWDTYAQNTFTYIGSHTSDCYVPANPELGFAQNSMKVSETDGAIMVNVSISNPSSTADATVEVHITGGSAANGTEYTATSPTTLTFAMSTTGDQTFNITINDNTMSELDKTIELTLRNATGADLSDSTMTVNIENDDYWVATIKDVRENDNDWKPKFDGQKVEVTGVVYGIDLDGNNGISFTIIDSTAGINIFNFRDVSDYVVNETDEITVRGYITSYNGLTELFADSIKVNGSSTLKTPTVVTKPTEETESDFIEIRKVWIADTTTVWPNNGNVSITNGTDTFLLRVDKDVTDMVGVSVDNDTMDILGIGGQFDNSAFPLDAGYQIFPRGIADIMQWDKTSVKDFSLIASVFPNPSTGVINVSAVQPIVHISVINAMGNTVISQPVTNTLGTSINLSEFAAGVYFITINAENASSVKRVVIK
ncbi:MAG: putative extracellular nuclease, partial [Bacteroidia bacterium]